MESMFIAVMLLLVSAVAAGWSEFMIKISTAMKVEIQKSQFTSTPGVNVQTDDPKILISILKTFLTEESIQNILDGANEYAKILLENPQIQAKMNNTQPTLFALRKAKNFDEIWILVTVTLLMGIADKPYYNMFCST